MSLFWKAALLAVILLALAIVPSYINTQAQRNHSEQFERGYDWRGPVNQY
jgi:hypothetical protein